MTAAASHPSVPVEVLRRRPRAALAALAALLLAGLLFVPVARAGQYTVTACGDGPNRSWHSFGDSSPIWHTGSVCPVQSGTNGIFVGHTGGTAGNGTGAGWVMDAAPGTTIVSTSQTYAVQGVYGGSGDLSYSLRLYTNTGTLAQCDHSNLGACVAPDYFGTFGPDQTLTFNAPGGSTVVAWSLYCGRSGGCPPGGRTYAALRIHRATVTLDDPSSPSLDNGRGSLWRNHTTWMGGVQDLGFTASDNSGISLTSATVDAQRPGQKQLASQGPGCDYSFARPCPDYDLALPQVDTRSWADGPHYVTFRANDAAGNNTTYTSPDPVYIDNHAPGQMSGLTVAGGENWRQSNGFDVSWANPAGQFAPITAARWRFCDSQGKNCGAVQSDAATNITSLSGLQVPRTGDYTLKVWLEDQAGNSDEQTAGGLVHLRFDDRPPSVAFEPLDPGDPLAVTVAAGDGDSGIAGGSIQIQQARASGSFMSLPTTYSGGRLTARLDDLHLRNGDYVLRAVATDVAGNQAGTGSRTDGSPATVRLPLRVPIRVIAGAASRTHKRCRLPHRVRAAGRRTRGRHNRGRGHRRGQRPRCVRVRTPVRTGPARVGFGHRKTIYGQVVTAQGRVPLARQPVRVLVRLLGHRRFRPGVILVTDASGGFRYRAPAGPARTVRFRYFGTNVLRASHADQVLRVPASSTIRARPRFVLNGGSVRLSGRLRGHYTPRGGVLVIPEVFFRGRWQPFATVRTTSTGRWARRYTFKATRGRVKYPFRVLVPASANYPYLTGASRAVHIVVQGL